MDAGISYVEKQGSTAVLWVAIGPRNGTCVAFVQQASPSWEGSMACISRNVMLLQGSVPEPHADAAIRFSVTLILGLSPLVGHAASPSTNSPSATPQGITFLRQHRGELDWEKDVKRGEKTRANARVLCDKLYFTNELDSPFRATPTKKVPGDKCTILENNLQARPGRLASRRLGSANILSVSAPVSGPSLSKTALELKDIGGRL